jgi:Protein of unknown function (DUF2815)
MIAQLSSRMQMPATSMSWIERFCSLALRRRTVKWSNCVTEETKKNPRIATLKNVRLSFTDSLGEAKATVKNGVPKHGCNILIEPDKPETDANRKAVIAALVACSEEAWQKADKWKLIRDKDPKRVQYRKGESFTNGDDEVYKGYEGAMVVPGYGPGGTKNPKRPCIMDRKKNWVWNPDKGAEASNSKILDVCYSGVYADVRVEFYAVTGADAGGDGIFSAIHLIRSRQCGDRMSGGYRVDESDVDEFDDLEDSDDDFGGAFDDD